MKLPSVMLLAGLNDRLTIHSTGTSAYSSTNVLATAHLLFAAPVVATAMSAPPLGVRARRGGAEQLDEDEGDQRDGDEDEHADRRPDAEVERPEQVVVTQHRDRSGAVRATGEDVDVVEDAERVERAEEQRHEDRGLHHRQDDLREPLPRPGAVHLGRLEQGVR